MEHSVIAQPAEDELRLSDVVIGLWDGRWVIAVAAALGIVGGLALNAVLSDAFEANLVMAPASGATAVPYTVLNRRLDFVPLHQMISDELTRASAPREGASHVAVTPSTLIEELIRELRSVPVVAASLDESGLLTRADFENEDEFLSEAARFAAGINFVPPAEQGDTTSFRRRFWQMSYAGEGTQRQIQAYAATAIDLSTANVRRSTYDVVSAAIEQRAEDEAFALDDLDALRDIAIEEYRSGVASRIAMLSEHAAIARRLGIENGDVGGGSRFEAETVAGESESLFSITQEAPAYLRGYSALEEEISLLRQRGDPELFVDTLPEIGVQVRRIEADQQVERARAALEASPLASDDFRLIDFVPGLVSIERRYPLPVILSIGLAFGAIAGVMLVGVANVLRNRRV